MAHFVRRFLIPDSRTTFDPLLQRAVDDRLEVYELLRQELF